MALLGKLRGITETLFQFGLGGPNWKANSGIIEARNAADAAFAIVRGATPVGADDLTTKTYVDGAGGGLTLTTTEVSIGTQPRLTGRFNITSSGLTTGKPVLISQANGPYTGKGARTDEAEMDHLSVGGKTTSATNIACFWSSPRKVRGNYKFDWKVGA